MQNIAEYLLHWVNNGRIHGKWRLVNVANAPHNDNPEIHQPPHN